MVLINIKLSNQMAHRKDEHTMFQIEAQTTDTWLNLLQGLNIIANPGLHYIKGSSNTHTAQLEETIEGFYSGFKKQLPLYKVDLKRKSAHQLKYDKLLNDTFKASLLSSNINGAPATPGPGIGNPAEENIGPFEQNRPHLPPQNQRVPITEPEYGDVHYNMRVEDTQEGNKVSCQDQCVTDQIRFRFQQRISNKDILAVRKELGELKSQQKYFSLTRAAPFTAGLLDNVFLSLNAVTS